MVSALGKEWMWNASYNPQSLAPSPDAVSPVYFWILIIVFAFLVYREIKKK